MYVHSSQPNKWPKERSGEVDEERGGGSQGARRRKEGRGGKRNGGRVDVVAFGGGQHRNYIRDAAGSLAFAFMIHCTVEQTSASSLQCGSFQLYHHCSNPCERRNSFFMLEIMDNSHEHTTFNTTLACILVKIEYF